jgi:1,4-alpha-glucan branching enzyme
VNATSIPEFSADDLQRLVAGRLHDPFRLLGRHGPCLRVLCPGATTVSLDALPDLPLRRLPDSDVFEAIVDTQPLPAHYTLRWRDARGQEHRAVDPYSFAPLLSEFDLHLFGQGRHWHPQNFLGAHPRQVDGVDGVLFAVWAPNADGISVVGDWNGWDGRWHPMRNRGDSGVWELFIPGVAAGALYKFELRTRRGLLLKSDPYARAAELRPATASRVVAPSRYVWGDQAWLDRRAAGDWHREPISIYELHLGSWRRAPDGGFLSYAQIADQLVPYVADLGFTHVELLPVTEHPLDASWGYQCTGYYAPTARHGDPDGLRLLIDRLHQAGIGVILDWVPAHFPKDDHALARFDGTALYEHEDPRLGEHPDWGTLVFNFGRAEVRSFLIGSALHWVEAFHVDGLRVDAVASMLYLDYSREPGQWLPNRHGGNENLEAVEFLREVCGVVQGQHPGALMIAEESTAWPQVTRPPWTGGLGFALKWNMGWMHDTLDYLGHDPVHRQYHHDHLTFGMLYAYTENFVLPLSHDEVVHGKRALLSKMPGDAWQRFANLRLLYVYQFTFPGKKLLFMGGEFGQWTEWNHDQAIDWPLLGFDTHRGVQALLRDVAHLYRDHPALHAQDFDPQGFEWVDCHDSAQSVVSYLRHGGGRSVLVVLNFTPVPRHGYRLGVPHPGWYAERLNSDSTFYGGSDVANGGAQAEDLPWMGRPWSITLTLPPLGALVLELP